MTREEAINILVRLPLLRMCTRDPIDKVSDALNMAIETLEERPHGKWIDHKDYSFSFCNVCGMGNNVTGGYKSNFCPNCGASMSANDRQVTGKLNEEPKDSHSEYWNSIGEWKEGEAE